MAKKGNLNPYGEQYLHDPKEYNWSVAPSRARTGGIAVVVDTYIGCTEDLRVCTDTG